MINSQTKLVMLIIVFFALLSILGIGFFYANKEQKVSSEGGQTNIDIQDQKNANSKKFPITKQPKSEDVVQTIIAKNYLFEPATFQVKKGQVIRVILQNKEGFHDFVINEFQAKTKKINANQSDEIVFTASKSGEFEYYCSVGQHRQMGMVGKLIVED